MPFNMLWLRDGEKILMICLFVLTQLTNVTDTRTDRHRTCWPRLCIASRGKNCARGIVLARLERER